MKKRVILTEFPEWTADSHGHADRQAEQVTGAGPHDLYGNCGPVKTGHAGRTTAACLRLSRNTRRMIMKRAVSALLLSLFMFLTSPVPSRSFTLPDFSAKKQITSLLKAPGLIREINPEALDLALQGYYNLKSQGLIRKEGILTLIDFDKPSDSERLYVIDVDKGVVLHSSLVAHGKGSGETMATRFSNIPGSNESSLGFYLTDTTYDGRNGYSLVLKGLDPGINDRAEERSIVIHGANYVSWDYIRRNGRLGRSQGCPALSFEESQQIIDMIKDGSCLFIYHKEKDFASRSGVLNSGRAFRVAEQERPS